MTPEQINEAQRGVRIEKTGDHLNIRIYCLQIPYAVHQIFQYGSSNTAQLVSKQLSADGKIVKDAEWSYSYLLLHS